MSVDRTAIIARGFLIDENPYEDDRFTDEFIDEWVICFDSWDDCGPYLIGYYIQRSCDEGVPVELTASMHDENLDNFLRLACRIAGIPIGDIKTYFGVRVS